MTAVRPRASFERRWGEGGQKVVCQKKGPTRCSQLQIPFFPTTVNWPGGREWVLGEPPLVF